MAKRRGFGGRGSSGRSGWRAAGIAAIVAFLIFDIALVYVALTGNRADDPAGAVSVPASTPPPSSAPADEEPVEQPEGEPSVEFPALSRLLAPASSTVAWRTLTGDCQSPVVVQRTEDGGATWVEYPVEAGVGARSLLAISAADTEGVRAIAGAGEACDPVQLESFSRGQFWRPSPEAAGLWHAAPLQPGVVVGPVGAVTTPCEAVSALTGLSDQQAAVACTDGSLHLTADAGATWGNAGAGGGVVGVAGSGGGYTVARVGADGCDGAEVAMLGADGLSPLSCLPVDPSEPVSLTAGGDALWMWAANDVWVSTDGGLTWA